MRSTTADSVSVPFTYIASRCSDASGGIANRYMPSIVCGDGLGGWYGGEWALYNNRTWEADSYNDWWHDRPERAYPAWMRRNQDCARQWYSGDTLTC